jgi:glycosyltransferase involved in cell wall biosynthesis
METAMHILFVHRNSPGQFEHIANYLVREKGHQCTFAGEEPLSVAPGVRSVPYRVRGRPAKAADVCSRAFEEDIRRARGVLKALKPLRNRLQPDLIVGHSGFGSTVFLPELFPRVPIINYFEYFAHPHHSALDFRTEWTLSEIDFLRARAQNAMTLLDLETCTAGYSPTRFQKGLFPRAYHSKIRVVHDGIDTHFWHRRRVGLRRLGRLEFGRDSRVVTYVARGLESTRGFDIFLKVAKRIYETDPRVVFLVVGAERVFYGLDRQHIREKSFFRHAWNQDDYDPRRFRFLGQVSRRALARIFSLSDLHIYLTTPFLVGWSLLNAMACECAVLASDTGPVREILRNGHNGVLRDFFDVDGLAQGAMELLRNRAGARQLGRTARATIRRRYSLPVVLPGLAAFYEKVARRATRW